MDYDLGLTRLQSVLDQASTRWLEFQLYRAQLLDNLNRERRYGSTEQLRNDRFRIVEGLNALCAVVAPGLSFADLCVFSEGEYGKAIPAPVVSAPSEAKPGRIAGASEVQRGVNTTPTSRTLDASAERPIFLQTVLDRLESVRNEYGTAEALLQSGHELPLVDARAADKLSEEDAVRRQRARIASFEPMLRGGSEATPISVVVPILGEDRILSECLQSIARQTLVQRRGEVVQVVIVEDGVLPGGSSVFGSASVVEALQELRRLKVSVVCLRLAANHGRAQARNVGLAWSRQPLVLFVDGSMILEREFLVEHVWRHGRLRNVALLGFKENIIWSEFEHQKREIVTGERRPDLRKDWKWSHLLTSDEVGPRGFEYNTQRFEAGCEIQYMLMSNWLKGAGGTESIGARTLPSFFQTNIVSVRRAAVLEVGGFEPLIQGWGLEDTFLGALLLASNICLVPCPTSVAFNLETSTAPGSAKLMDLEFNKAKYRELLSKTRMSEYSMERFHKRVAFLRDKVEVVQPDID